ncbi:DUF5994 family protein [Actinocorallia lasiicapitis]
MKTDIATPLAARVRLEPSRKRYGGLDGGWWPRSGDPVPEFTALAEALSGPLGPVIRLTVDRADWPDLPRRIVVNGRQVRIGTFSALNHKIIVTCGRDDVYLLLVVPPGADPAAADRALIRAATGSDTRPDQLLLQSGVLDADGALIKASGDNGQFDRWLDDGASG